MSHRDTTPDTTGSGSSDWSWQPDFTTVDPGDFMGVNSTILADAPPVLSRRGVLAYGLVQLVIVLSLVEKAFVQDMLHIGGG